MKFKPTLRSNNTHSSVLGCTRRQLSWNGHTLFCLIDQDSFEGLVKFAFRRKSVTTLPYGTHFNSMAPNNFTQLLTPNFSCYESFQLFAEPTALLEIITGIFLLSFLLTYLLIYLFSLSFAHTLVQFLDYELLVQMIMLIWFYVLIH